jgi:amino acid transporter
LIALGALFSTASAINATLFGSANVSYMLAKDGELPAVFSRHLWQGGSGGLVITAVMVLLFVLFFDLSGVAMMGSGAFLLIYGAVGVAHLRVISQTGANKSLVWLSILTCLVMAAILSYYIYQNSRPAFVTMFALIPLCLGSEWVYQGQVAVIWPELCRFDALTDRPRLWTIQHSFCPASSDMLCQPAPAYPMPPDVLGPSAAATCRKL